MGSPQNDSICNIRPRSNPNSRSARVHRNAPWFALLSLCWCVLPCGCDLPERPTISHSSAPAPREAEIREDFEPPTVPWSGPWEAWFLYVRDDHPVGFSHMQATFGPDHPQETLVEIPAGAELELKRVSQQAASVWYDVEDVIRFERGKAVFLQSLEQVTRESSTGQFLGFWNRLRVGPAETQATGVVEDEQLMIETTRGQKRSSRSLPWGKNDRGVFAVMQSLKQNPMRPGQTRQLRHLSPIKHQIVSIRLSAISETAVPWVDGTTRLLLEISQEVTVDGQPVSASVLWVDEEGEIQRSFTPQPLDLIAYRVDRETLLEKLQDHRDLRLAVKENRLQAPSNAWVRVSGKRMPDPDQVQRVGFIVETVGDTLNERTSTPAILPAPDQYIKQINSGEVQLLISRSDEVISGGFETHNQETVPNDLRPTALLNFMVKEVRDIGVSALQAASYTDREICLELAKTVTLLMERTADVGDFSSASDIALTGRGGAVEHSILLAALLRSQRIPSRLALGLVYDAEDEPRLKFSAWTLAHIDGQWITIDPLRGKLAAADRIILEWTDTTKPIDEVLFTRILRQLEQLNIRVHAFQNAPKETPEA